MKIVVYGAGMVGKKILTFPLRRDNEIVLWLDSKEELWGNRLESAGRIYKIKSPDMIKETEFDILLLAVVNGWMDVMDKCLDMGVDHDKIVLAEGWSRADYYVDELDRYFDIQKKNFIPFARKPVVNPLGHCGGETDKAETHRNREGFFERYCSG